MTYSDTGKLPSPRAPVDESRLWSESQRNLEWYQAHGAELFAQDPGASLLLIHSGDQHELFCSPLDLAERLNELTAVSRSAALHVHRAAEPWIL